MSGSVSVSAVTSSRVVGEGPHWDATRKVLYYVDAVNQQVRKYDPTDESHTAATLDTGVSFVIPVEGHTDKFAVGLGHNISVVTWDGKSETPSDVQVVATMDEEEEKRDNRINDAKADATGRLWTGTMNFKPNSDDYKKNMGSIFSLSHDNKVTKHVSGITLSNGFAWTKDSKTMFYVDSLTYKVDAFDFNIETGSITNRRTVFDFPTHSIPGVPDGITIDTEDKLWVANFGGARVVQIDPSVGALLRTVQLPAPNITSVAFGGDRLDELYVTSATIAMAAEDLARFPDAGRTFRVTGLGARGFPMNHVRFD